jgi:hypothetical protein
MIDVAATAAGEGCTQYPSIEMLKLCRFAQERLKGNGPSDLLSGISEMSKTEQIVTSAGAILSSLEAR